jgi:sulfonate transport system ATP-binding protein
MALYPVSLQIRRGEVVAIVGRSGSGKSTLLRLMAGLENPGSGRILVEDEPLGALDALTRLEMQTLIERLWLESQFSAVLVTHDVEEAVALADRVLVMEGGKLTFETAVELERPRTRSDRAFVDPTPGFNLVEPVFAPEGQLRLARHFSAGWGHLKDVASRRDA